jgi:hypothetical protein
MQETENHSPGSRTEAGKQRSSQNAIKHGIFSKTILIAGEIRAEFDRLLLIKGVSILRRRTIGRADEA